MRRPTVLFAALLLTLGMMATPAAAHHQHYIDTPKGKQITLPCEPAGTAAADRHPLHWRLHLSPSADSRAIVIHHHGVGSCSNPQPPGPTGALPFINPQDDWLQ